MPERLIDTAIHQFGEHGFDGASTRMIAAAADTTMSNITYHFGGKEGLYIAAGQEVIDRLNAAFSERPIKPLNDDASPEQRADLVCTVLQNMGEFMLREEVEPMARFVAREHDNPDSHFGKLLCSQVLVIGTTISEQVAHLRPELSADEQRITAFYLYAMATALRSFRAPLCVITETDNIDDNLARTALDQLATVAHHILRIDA